MAESCLASVFFRPKIWACEKNHLLQKMAQGSSTFDLRAVKLENYFVPFKTGQEPGRAGPLWGKELMLLVLHLFGNTSLCAGVAAKRTFLSELKGLWPADTGATSRQVPGAALLHKKMKNKGEEGEDEMPKQHCFFLRGSKACPRSQPEKHQK